MKQFLWTWILATAATAAFMFILVSAKRHDAAVVDMQSLRQSVAEVESAPFGELSWLDYYRVPGSLFREPCSTTLSPGGVATVASCVVFTPLQLEIAAAQPDSHLITDVDGNEVTVWEGTGMPRTLTDDDIDRISRAVVRALKLSQSTPR